ncbi:unnamed protein product [Urochloa humidicola]
MPPEQGRRRRGRIRAPPSFPASSLPGPPREGRSSRGPRLQGEAPHIRAAASSSRVCVGIIGSSCALSV